MRISRKELTSYIYVQNMWFYCSFLECDLKWTQNTTDIIFVKDSSNYLNGNAENQN